MHAVEKRVTDVFVKLSAVALTPSCPRRNFTPFESCTCIPDFTEYTGTAPVSRIADDKAICYKSIIFQPPSILFVLYFWLSLTNGFCITCTVAIESKDRLKNGH